MEALGKTMVAEKVKNVRRTAWNFAKEVPTAEASVPATVSTTAMAFLSAKSKNSRASRSA